MVQQHGRAGAYGDVHRCDPERGRAWVLVVGVDMNIEEIAKEVGITSPDGFKLTVNPVQIDKLQAFANAVIKAHTEELIEGAGVAMNIIELARKAGLKFYELSPMYCESVNIPTGSLCHLDSVSFEDIQAFAAAVIKARDAELIAGVGEPAHHIMSDGQCIGYYSAEQVAAAVAEAYQQGKHDEEMAQGPSEFEGWERDRLLQRIATLESTLKVALEALEEATTYTSSPSWSPSMTEDCNKAINRIKEVLHG